VEQRLVIDARAIVVVLGLVVEREDGKARDRLKRGQPHLLEQRGRYRRRPPRGRRYAQSETRLAIHRTALDRAARRQILHERRVEDRAGAVAGDVELVTGILR